MYGTCNGVLLTPQWCGSTKWPCDVSLTRLLSFPQAYDGRTVQTAGYLTLGFENQRLYLSREAADHFILFDSITIVGDVQRFEHNDAFHGYVFIEGSSINHTANTVSRRAS